MSDPAAQLIEGLAGVMARGGITGDVSGLQRLSGGANMQSWLFSCGGEAFVLRRTPSSDLLEIRTVDLAGEAALIRHATKGGVIAPEVIAELRPEDGIGIGFVMRAIAGTADPKVVLAGDPGAMITDIAGALARIHALDVSALGFLPQLDAGEGVEKFVAQFESFGGDRPIIALGLQWLRAHLPPPTPPRLVHGDMRIGNLMAEDGRLTGVLDWELAHLGDPHEDLAYGCMTVWRFGKIDRPAFGFCDLEPYFAAYEAAGGEKVDRARFRFWLIYRSVWWALASLDMGRYWREGLDRSLERVVISRRVAEQEVDLLLLLEEAALEDERRRALPPAPAVPAAPKGEASAGEILTAISEWLAEAVKPKLEGRNRFDLAVAQNALGIVSRELAMRPAAHDPALAQDILAGRAGLETPGLLARLRRMALDKLSADIPKYPTLGRARAQWEGN